MNGYAELIKSELSEAILERNEQAIDRLSIIIGERLNRVEDIKEENSEIKGDIRELIGIVKTGFEQVDKRFEDMNKKFNMMFAFITIGYTVITGLIVLFKFLK